MKQVVLEFDDEEMELLEEQFKQIQDVAGMETIEDYIYYATMSHCKTMQAASKMFGQSGDIEKLMADENVHVGVVNMPYVKCPDCDKKIYMFGKSHSQEVADRYQLPLLGQLPIDSELTQLSDQGYVENVHVGVVNMPIQLSNVEDKDEFSRYLNDVLNDAVKDFMNRNNEPLN